MCGRNRKSRDAEFAWKEGTLPLQSSVESSSSLTSDCQKGSDMIALKGRKEYEGGVNHLESYESGVREGRLSHNTVTNHDSS
jgi:hypothetical protein